MDGVRSLSVSRPGSFQHKQLALCILCPPVCGNCVMTKSALTGFNQTVASSKRSIAALLIFESGILEDERNI
jgi:hypothetical protein